MTMSFMTSNSSESGLVRRKTNSNNKNKFDDNVDDLDGGKVDGSNDSSDNETEKVPKFTLMEEVLLLGLKDKEGYTSFWNDCLSSGLRGCILVELCLRRRIALDDAGMTLGSFRLHDLMSRYVIVVSDQPCGDMLLDEALRHIKSIRQTVLSWIEYLSGETWNPMKLRFQLRNVRERLAKSLSEKGVLGTDKQNFLLFDMTTHPLVDVKIKDVLRKDVRCFLLNNWTNEVARMDKRGLARILLAHYSDVIENVFSVLNDDDYSLCKNRLRDLSMLDFEALGQKKTTNNNNVSDKKSSKEGQNFDVMWAVFTVFSKCM